MAGAGAIGAALAAITAILIGILFNRPLATKTGIFRWTTKLSPALIGVIPALTPPRDEWGYTFEHLSRADLRGQNAIVTGANSGIGFEVAKALSRQGAAVTLACRNPQRCFHAADRIRTDEEYSGAPVTPLMVDVSSLRSVQSAATTFLSHSSKLDMLYLNAGIISAGTNADGTLLLSKDGVEMVFATNVLGHHLLFRLLEPALQQSSMARVVLTSSLASFGTYEYGVATDLETLNGVKPSALDSPRLYGHSKLAQILWAKAVTRNLGPQSNVYVNSANPGAVTTVLMNKNPYFPHTLTRAKAFFEKRVIWKVEEGALTLLYLGVATDELREKNVRGRYFHPMAVEVENPLSMDEELQDKLLAFCDGLVKDYVETK